MSRGRLRHRRWRTTPCPDQAAAHRLQADLGLSPLAAQLLVTRGVATAEEADRFLNPSYHHLPDPLLLPDAEAAVERIRRALADNEPIFVHGDYDGDGVTSAALWARLLDRLGGDVKVRVPHRRRDGYDMRSGFVQEAKADGVRLIVTTDCGIQRCDEVEEAREAGIDVVITDHHTPGEALPRAVAVVNPHRRDSAYPFQDLAGVGVAYRVGEALVRRLGHSVDGYRRAYGDLAAIGTVTDMMPLREDNRVFVRHGLEALRTTQKAGLQSLMRRAGLLDKPVDAYGIGFRLGPRLNAIGRVDDARMALDLLMTRDLAEADALAEKLECANQQRRQEQERILTAALEQLSGRDLSDCYCIVLAGADWHAGVIGIVASKLVERTGRPTVLVALDPESGEGRGSARSIPAFHVLDAITECADCLIEFGGHAHAAGMQVSAGAFDAFAERMNGIARSLLTEEDLRPALVADAEIAPTELKPGLLHELSRFEPWGRENPEPLVVCRNMRVTELVRMGADKQHLKIRSEYDGMPAPDAVFWSRADVADHLRLDEHIDLCCYPRLNVWNGSARVQLVAVDLRPSNAEEW